jgi:predicted nuclease of predicted toxin-antitoxin system
MRFLADENVSMLVVARLRAAGLDVLAISEMNAGAPDNEVLATANREACILLTEDRDFGEFIIRQRLGVRGIVLLELDRLSNVAESERVAETKLAGNLLVIEPSRVRVRPLSG